MGKVRYQVEEGIPIPDWPPGHKPEAPSCGGGMYPFEDLGVMQSFYVPIRFGESVQKTARRIAPRVSRESRYEKKFISRKCLDGVRVWRVE